MAEDKKIETVELKVLGMACGGCKAAVEKALQGLEGVSSARVNLTEKTALITYDSNKLGLQDLKKAIQGAGYTVS